MSYLSFESATGNCLAQVRAICRALTVSGEFTDTGPITGTDVDMFLDNSYYWLLGELTQDGYAITAITDTEVKAVLTQIQALDAATQVEHSMPVTAQGEPNERWRSLVARRDYLVKTFLRGNGLERLGATRTTNKSDYLEGTGRSIAAKQAVYDNTDVVAGRFPAGFGARRDIAKRSGSQQSGGADPSQT